jgi:alkylhydroperoxidase family enzyme
MSSPAPRIAPLEPPYPLEIQEQFDKVMPPGVPPLVLFRTIATSARAYGKLRGGSMLDRGPLTLRDREIVIDRTCALNRCEYEWGVHVAFFQTPAKLTDEQVRATVLGGADAPCWSMAEQALIAAVDALHHRSAWTDDEFAALKAHYDSDKILEIIQLCGAYRTISYFCNALKLPLETTAARFPKA